MKRFPLASNAVLELLPRPGARRGSCHSTRYLKYMRTCSHHQASDQRPLMLLVGGAMIDTYGHTGMQWSLAIAACQGLVVTYSHCCVQARASPGCRRPPTPSSCGSRPWPLTSRRT